MGHSRAQATYDPRSSEDALKHIIEVVKKRNLQGKAVVNHSYGMLPLPKKNNDEVIPLTHQQEFVTEKAVGL